jgi:hypothetical protein
MARFDGRPLGIAIAEVRVTNTFPTSSGPKTAESGSQFVWLWVVLKNFSSATIQFLYWDQDFSLSTRGGYTVNVYCSGSSPGSDLPPNGSRAAWLVFQTLKRAEYILNRAGGVPTNYMITANENQKRVFAANWKAKLAFPPAPTPDCF